MKLIWLSFVCNLLLTITIFSQVPNNGLAAYYPFNGNANDESGNGNNGTVYGATLTADRFGNPNKAYSFNGADNYIDFKDGVYFKGDFTFSGWCKIRDFRYWCRFIDFGTGPTADNIILALSSEKTGYISSEIWNGGNRGGQIADSTVLELNTWLHLVYQLEGNEVRIYKNGQLLLKGTTTQIPQNIIRTNNYLAKSNWTGDGYTNAIFDDIRIYNRSLNDYEINELFHENGWGQTPVAYFPFNGNANDESGNGNNGIVYGANLTIDRFGNRKQAYNFNGTDSYIQIADNISLNLSNYFTVCAWVRPEAFSYLAGVVSKYNSSTTQSYSLRCTGIQPFNKIVFCDVPCSDTLTTNKWYFLTGKIEGTTSKIYINGTLAGSGTLAYTLGKTYDPLTIGLDYLPLPRYFKGDIDDIRIFNRALIDSEILSLYHENEWNPTDLRDLQISPNVYSLKQNYPNPFNPSTLISFSLQSASNVKLIIYNSLGQNVKVLENGFKSAGDYSIIFNGGELSSGIYFYRLTAGQFSQVKKMILLK
jgi:hypothetical protein